MPAAKRGCTVWLTGLSGAGKSTITALLSEELRRRGRRVEVLDGDEVRENLSKGLGFSKEDRDTNIRRIGWVADRLTRNGVFVIVAAISPYRAVRDEVRQLVGDFVEVHVDCSLEVLTERDVKGLYARALAGEIKNFTGVSDPYEAPLRPEVRVDSAVQTVQESVAAIIAVLSGEGYLGPGGEGNGRAPVLDLQGEFQRPPSASGLAAPHGGVLTVRQAEPARAAELAAEAAALAPI